MSDSATLRTPLHALHVELGARMGPFAGYDMPIQYGTGILAEHLHTRSRAGLFDVSHMGQAELVGPDHATVAAALDPSPPFIGISLSTFTSIEGSRKLCRAAMKRQERSM